MIEKEAVSLFKEALSLKKKGAYEESLSSYGKILQSDKYDYFAYQGIAKVYFLMKDKDAAVRNYLISMHLQMIDDEEKSRNDDAESLEIREMIAQMPSETSTMLSSVDSKALFLFLNDNTSLHMAHALNDLVKSKYPSESHKKKYCAALMGNDVEITKRYLDVENGFYRNLGFDFALNMIDFKCSRAEALGIYFNIPYDAFEKTYFELYKKHGR